MNWPAPFVTLRDELARWIMRSKEAGSVLQMLFWGITAVSTMITALRGTAYDGYAPAAVTVLALGSLAFMWAYDRFEVLNLQQRERMDRGDNFAGPGMAIGALIHARQYAALAEAISHGEGHEQAHQRIERSTLDALREYRDGIALEDVYYGPSASPDVTHPLVGDGGQTRQTLVVPECGECETPGRPGEHKGQGCIVCPDCERILYKEMGA